MTAAEPATNPRARAEGNVPAWLPPLPVAAAIVAVAVLLGWSALEYARALAGGGVRGTDLAQYYVAAGLTLAHGWAAPYDVADFMTALNGLTGFHDAYANLPAATVLAMPLTRLPLVPAYAIWNALLLAGFAAACWASAPGRGWKRLLQLLASAAAFQVLSAMALGQLGLAVAALVVLHWWLLREGRPILAGLAIGLAFVKPQNVFLVPLALLLSGRVRAAFACLAAAGAVGAACAVALGPDGVRAYVQSVTYELQNMRAGHDTLASALGGAVPTLALAVVPVVLTALTAVRNRRHGPERTIVASVVGSQVATPYLNGADLALVLPSVWLTMRSDPPRWLTGLAVAVNFVPFAQAAPLRILTFAILLAWLGALALLRPAPAAE